MKDGVAIHEAISAKVVNKTNIITQKKRCCQCRPVGASGGAGPAAADGLSASQDAALDGALAALASADSEDGSEDIGAGGGGAGSDDEPDLSSPDLSTPDLSSPDLSTGGLSPGCWSPRGCAS